MEEREKKKGDIYGVLRFVILLDVVLGVLNQCDDILGILLELGLLALAAALPRVNLESFKDIESRATRGGGR